jgi:hypothetical protein
MQLVRLGIQDIGEAQVVVMKDALSNGGPNLWDFCE